MACGDKTFWIKAILVVGMLLTGSINTIAKSAQNTSRQVGMYHIYHCWSENNNTNIPDVHNQHQCAQKCPGCQWTDLRFFDAPWFQTLIMFTGEALALIGLFFHRKCQKQRHEQEALIRPQKPPPKVFQPILLAPTFCDLLGTTLSGIGLLYVYASVWQMLRGSIIIFTGIFSVIFLKRRLKVSHWLGMFVSMIGLLMVGLASVLALSEETGATSHTKAQTVLGLSMILAAQVVSAAQMVIEETFLKKRNFPPLQVVGMEGVFGMILMIILVLPIVYFIPGDQPSHFSHGSYENSLDAAVMIGQSPKLLGFCLLYLFSITFYNFCGLAVTKKLSAVHRTLIDACRTLVVWAVDLLIRYGFKESSYGEAWTSWSLKLQLPGFLVLLTGTLLYNNIIRIPGTDVYFKQLCCPSRYRADEDEGALKPLIEEVGVINDDPLVDE